MARKGKPVNPTLLPTAALSLLAFAGLSLLLGDQMAQGQDPKVKPEQKPQRPVKTIVKHKVITKKIVVWKTPKPEPRVQAYTPPVQTYAAPVETYTAPAQSYSAPAEPSPAPPVQSSSS